LLDKEKLDVVFVEGLHALVAKRGDIAKIITAKNLEDLKRTLEGTAPPILAVTGRVVEKKFEMPGLQAPLVNLYNEGDFLFKLVKDYIGAKPKRVQ